MNEIELREALTVVVASQSEKAEPKPRLHCNESIGNPGTLPREQYTDKNSVASDLAQRWRRGEYVVIGSSHELGEPHVLTDQDRLIIAALERFAQSATRETIVRNPSALTHIAIEINGQEVALGPGQSKTL